MLSNIVVKRGHQWSVIRDVSDIELPYICTKCGYTEHHSIHYLDDHTDHKCSDCLGHMIIYHIPETRADK
jgi:predicted nucleic-acid-binding Zn-ribbon protein